MKRNIPLKNLGENFPHSEEIQEFICNLREIHFREFMVASAPSSTAGKDPQDGGVKPHPERIARE